MMAVSESSTQVALLHQISNIVSSNLILERMLEELIGLAVDVTDCDACLVYLVDHSSNEVVLRASQLPHTSEIDSIRLKIGEGITGWVAQHRSVVALSSNAAADARFKRFKALPEDTYEAFLSVPLISNGELIGVINIHHKARHSHTPEEIALVSFIGEQMGGAIAKSKLAERSESASRRMEVLAGLAQTISEENYLDRILQAIAEMLAETLDSPVCSIMLVDEERRELVISAACCSSPDYLHKMPLKIEDSLIGRVVREARPIMIPNVLEEKQYRYPELARRTGLASLLSLPLMTRDRVMGTINIYTKEVRQFTEDEIGFVKVVAGQAAIAIENARLMSETLEMKRALEIRKIVERAKGILQHKHNLTEADAYLKLRNESRRLRRPMKELAEAIILADDLEK
ncbi:MAG TPA: GAF domain-containing protein [Bryobacteraceae bacterium]|nr:GAF domain-containing protein [Bryobacteraceae bacterium]